MTFAEIPIGAHFLDDLGDRWERTSKSHARRLRDGVEIWWGSMWAVEPAP